MKNAINNGKIVKTWSSFLARYGHPWTRKRFKIGHFPQRLVFTLPLGFADDFPNPNAQKRRFSPEVLIQRS